MVTSIRYFVIVGFLLILGGTHSVHALLSERDSVIARDEIIDDRERGRIAAHEARERIEEMRDMRNQRVRDALHRPPQEDEGYTQAQENNRQRYPNRTATASKPESSTISLIAIIFAVVSGVIALAAWYLARKNDE